MNILQYDPLHYRIDIPRLLSHALTLVAAALWALLAHPAGGNWLLYGVAGFAFVFVMRLVLGRLGGSRLGSLLVVIAALVLFGGYSWAQLAELTTFVGVVFLAEEYFVHRTKLIILVASILAGVLAAGEGAFGISALIIFGALLLSRIVWHALFERLSKKVWVLFSAKAVVGVGIASAVYCALHTHLHFAWASTQPLLYPHIGWVVLIIAALLMARGIWATLLLRTKRSPDERGLRVYFVAFTVALLGVIALLKTYGADVFLPSIMQDMATAGWLRYNAEITAAAFVTGSLLISAAIDRSLYKDTKFGRLFYRPTRPSEDAR